MRLLLLFLFVGISSASHLPEDWSETDGDTSRKILGSSVVTSVSVVMETGNGTKAVFTDAVGKPQLKPHSASDLASPIDLLNPDRYEFYTFDDNGELVKRLMSLEEIKSIIATGDTDAFDLDTFSSNGILPEKRVTDIISNVQNVLKEEMEIHKSPPNTKPIFDTPDVSDSWSMILPAIFGNSGEDIHPDKPMVHVTPDTIMIEPNSILSTTQKDSTLKGNTKSSTTQKPTTTKKHKISSSTYSSKEPFSVSNPTQIFSTQASTVKTSSFKKPSVTTSSLKMSSTPRPNKSTSGSPTTVRGSTSTRSTIDSSKIPLYKITRIPPRPTFNLDYDIPLFKSTPDTEQILSTSNQYPINRLSSTLRPMTSQMTSIGTHGKYPSTEGFLITKLETTSQKLETSPILPMKFITKQPNIPETSKPIPATESSTKTNSGITKPQSTLTKFTITSTAQSSATPTRYSSILPTITSIFPDLVRNPQQEKINSSTTTEPIYPVLQIITRFNDTSDSSIYAIQQSPITKNATTLTNLTTSNSEISPSTQASQIMSTENKLNTEKLTSTLNPHLYTWIPTSSPTSHKNKSTESVTKPPTTERESEATGITTFTNLPNREETTLKGDQITSTTILDSETSTTNQDEKATLPYDQHLSATELLDQLLQSTNIYEINSELISPQKNKFQKIDSTTTEKQEEITTLESVSPTTTEHDFISYPPTTDFTLLQSIEKILSQAVSDVNTVVDPMDTKKIQEILDNFSNKNLSQVTKNYSTVASDLTAGAKIEEDLTLPFEQTTAVTEKLTETSIKTNLDKNILTEKPHYTITNRKSDDIENVKENEQTYATTTVEEESLSITTENINENYITSTVNNFNLNDSTEGSEIINITLISYLTDNKSENLNKDLKKEEILNSTPFVVTTSEDTLEELVKTTTELEDHLLTTPETLGINKNSEEFPTSTNINSEITTLEITTEESITTSALSTEKNVEQNSSSTLVSPTSKFITSEGPTTEKVIRTTKPIKKPLITITINENGNVVTEKTNIFRRTTALLKEEIKPSKEDNIASSTQNLRQEDLTSVTPKVLTTTHDEGNWTLVSTVAPHDNKTYLKKEEVPVPAISYPEIIDPPKPVDLVPKPIPGFGLEDSTATLDTDLYQFAQLCNELAFGFWKSVTADLSAARSVFVSPFAATSMLAMVFLGARGATSGEMNEILKLDDMVTFNPHLTFKNVSESIMNEKDSDVSISIMVRELFSDKSKGKLLDFYKNRVRAFYDGFVEEVSFKEIGDVIRRRTNLMVKKYSNGRIPEFLRDSSITARSPLAGISANIFQTDCAQTSTEGRDGELHFVVSPSIRQRRLIPIPAVVYKSGFLAGYETSLDATAIAIGTKDQIVSTILVIPGQQGLPSQADSLARLEKRLVESSFKKGAWSRLLRSLIPRNGLEAQIPRFAHRSIINATQSLQKMGLHELFDAKNADLRGLNGIANELYLSEVLQINSFATCGEKTLDSHHLEVYPTGTAKLRSARYLQDTPDVPFDSEPRDYQRSFTDPLNDPEILSLPFSDRPRQARLPDAPPRLRFDRPFLYFVRHNPTGLILHMGRFNPRLLP